MHCQFVSHRSCSVKSLVNFQSQGLTSSHLNIAIGLTTCHRIEYYPRCPLSLQALPEDLVWHHIEGFYPVLSRLATGADSLTLVVIGGGTHC